MNFSSFIVKLLYKDSDWLQNIFSVRVIIAICQPIFIIIFIHQHIVDMQKIMIQQMKNLNNLTKQNVCVQYPVLQR